jgi:hypothetical protein
MSNGDGAAETMRCEVAARREVAALDQRVIDLLCTKNNQLREALKFYADEKNYLQPGWRLSPTEVDGGKIARAALEKK